MAAIANIVINDAQATPVAHTFAPAKTTADMAMFEDRALGIYVGFNKLTLALERPKGASQGATRNLKLRVLLETPKLETVSNSTVSGIAPQPTISYRPTVEMTVTLPERCLLQDRKDLRQYLRDLLATAPLVDAFEKYEIPF